MSREEVEMDKQTTIKDISAMMHAVGVHSYKLHYGLCDMTLPELPGRACNDGLGSELVAGRAQRSHEALCDYAARMETMGYITQYSWGDTGTNRGYGLGNLEDEEYTERLAEENAERGDITTYLFGKSNCLRFYIHLLQPHKQGVIIIDCLITRDDNGVYYITCAGHGSGVYVEWGGC